MKRLLSNDRLDQGDQICKLERFDHVRIGAIIERALPGLVIVSSGQHNDFYIFGSQLTLERSQDLKTVRPRHHDIEENAIEPAVYRSFHAFVACPNRVNRHTSGLETLFDQNTGFSVIFDAQYPAQNPVLLPEEQQYKYLCYPSAANM
jgi:hypothetical protein